MEALHELLNHPITLELRESSSSTLLASAAVDLLPFALGVSPHPPWRCAGLPHMSLRLLTQ